MMEPPVLLCRLGIHRWQGRATDRPGTTVYRCTRCSRRLVLHRNRARFHKRYVLLGVVAVSLAMWLVIVNVARTGHTRVIHTTARVVHSIERNGSRVRSAIHRSQGDEGNYVDGR